MTPGGEKAGPGAFVGEARALLVKELRPPMWSMTEETVAPMLSARCTATAKETLGWRRTTRSTALKVLGCGKEKRGWEGVER